VADTETLPAALDVLEIGRTREVLMRPFTQEEIDRWAYEGRVEALRYQSSLFRMAREAKERGYLLGQIHAYQKLLKQPLSPPTGVGVSTDALAYVLEQVSKQILPSGG
jgi:hypothetical protein